MHRFSPLIFHQITRRRILHTPIVNKTHFPCSTPRPTLVNSIRYSVFVDANFCFRFCFNPFPFSLFTYMLASENMVANARGRTYVRTYVCVCVCIRAGTHRHTQGVCIIHLSGIPFGANVFAYIYLWVLLQVY